MSGRADISTLLPAVAVAVQAGKKPESRKVNVDLIEVIEKFNPRGYATGESAFAGVEFEKLKASIALYGDVWTPVLLRPSPTRMGSYQLVAGERRLRAVRALGEPEISAEIRELSDAQMEQVVREENTLRVAVVRVDHIVSSMHVMRKHVAVGSGELRALLIRLRKVPDAAWPEESAEARALEVIARLGLPSLSTLVRTWSQYLELTDPELKAMRNGLSEDAALALIKITDPEARLRMLADATVPDHVWTAAQMTEAVRALLEGPAPEPTPPSAGLKLQLKVVRRSLSQERIAALSEGQQTELERDLEALHRKYFGD